MSRIMIIDDDEGVRVMLRRMLEREGHTVIDEPDGKSALRHFAGDPADLVISDVYMPGMDGIDFLLRVRDTFPEARIIMISGGGQLEADTVLNAASRLGADRVVKKPFSVTDMLEEVRAVLVDRQS